MRALRGLCVISQVSELLRKDEELAIGFITKVR
jgi:hypothetical protein